MAFDERLAGRVRARLAHREDVEEKRMFGGLAFMVHGHMGCGVIGEDLMVRLGEEGVAKAARDPGARPMDFTGKPLKGMLYVGPEGTKGEKDLDAWVQRALAFVDTLPAR